MSLTHLCQQVAGQTYTLSRRQATTLPWCVGQQSEALLARTPLEMQAEVPPLLPPPLLPMLLLLRLQAVQAVLL